MWMEVHINKVKAKGQAGNIWVKEINNDNIKRSKLEENQLGVLKKLGILLGSSAEASGLGASAVGVTYLPMRIRLKSCCISPLKVTATSLSGLTKGAVGA